MLIGGGGCGVDVYERTREGSGVWYIWGLVSGVWGRVLNRKAARVLKEDEGGGEGQEEEGEGEGGGVGGR